MYRFVALLVVTLLCSAAWAQNLLTNPSFTDPAYARLKIRQPVVDGDYVGLNINGAAEYYEFDDNGALVDASRTPVDVTGDLSAKNAANKLAAAINANTSSVATAASNNVDEARIHWKGTGGNGAINTSSVDGGNQRLEIDDFNERVRENSKTIVGWSGTSLRDGTQFSPSVPLDTQRATLQGSGGTQKVYQTVTGLDSSKTYVFTGFWTLGDFSPAATFRAELHAGSDPESGLLAEQVVVLSKGGKYEWLPFAVKASGATTLTVVLRMTDTGGGTVALHVDNVSLAESTCTPPVITTVAPATLLTNTTYDDAVTVSGSGFVPGATTVRLKGDAPEIAATDVKVSPDGNSLTCDFVIPAEAPIKPRAMVVEVTGCGGNSLMEAVDIGSSSPFSNGSFELPAPVYNQCPAQPQSWPSPWDAVEINGYGGMTKLFRDSLEPPLGPPAFAPTCPPPDGWHYAGTTSEANGASSPSNFIFQTFQVTAAQPYTFSGYFAGGGANIVTMEMRDGTTTGILLASAEVHSAGGSYDWTFNAIAGTPTGTLMTVGWRVNPVGPGPHASYADKLQVLPCTAPVTATSVTPSRALNTGTINITDLSGTGFAAGAQVLLSKPGTVVNASNVEVVSPTRITCAFNLADLPSGSYDVVVVQGGCIARLSSASKTFLVIGSSFVNSSFEFPTAPQDCGGGILGTPTGWNTNGDLHRDGSPHEPACPALPDGLHYGTMTAGEGETERAWQTVSVLPSSTYRLAGQFAGGGNNQVTIKLLDGDENGTVLGETTVHTGVDPYPWTQFQVLGAARSDAMTVMWSITSGEGGSSAHADNLVFESVMVCNDPFADSDGDGDVDQKDFAALQLCLTLDGTVLPATPSYCSCFNRNPGGDQSVDSADVAAFIQCGSGPGVPADKACD